jgi:chloramphenicol-sensitive protein RarD
MAVGLTMIGVVYITISYGRLPWISLSLALTFGLYGLVKKTAPLGPLHGLTLKAIIAEPGKYQRVYNKEARKTIENLRYQEQ